MKAGLVLCGYVKTSKKIIKFPLKKYTCHLRKVGSSFSGPFLKNSSCVAVSQKLEVACKKSLQFLSAQNGLKQSTSKMSRQLAFCGGFLQWQPIGIAHYRCLSMLTFRGTSVFQKNKKIMYVLIALPTLGIY